MEPCRLGIGEEVDDIIELKVRALDVEGYFVGLDESMLPMLRWLLLMRRTITVAIFEDGEVAGSSITRTAVAMLRPRFGDLYFGIHCLCSVLLNFVFRRLPSNNTSTLHSFPTPLRDLNDVITLIIDQKESAPPQHANVLSLSR